VNQLEHLGEELAPSTGLEPAPILRWMGSKRRSADEIANCIGAVAGRFYEPFAGGAAVLAALQPHASSVSDVNSDLIGAYTVLRRCPDELHAAITAMEVNEPSYYRHRLAFHSLSAPFERAVYFIYLNRNCFNGIYRTNRSNEFNVPYGRATGALPSLDAFRSFANLLRGADLTVDDFESATTSAEEGDVAYLDPPYPAVRATYGEYGYGTFSPDDVRRLERCASRLANNGVRVVVTVPPAMQAEMPSLKNWNTQTRRRSYTVGGGRVATCQPKEVTLYSWCD
jgi:DNA adenine methylase